MKPEHLLQKVLQNAQAALEPYRETPKEIPDPSFILQLPDETFSSSNLYAVQKMLEGTFQFDVFFDSGSSKQTLEGAMIKPQKRELLTPFSINTGSRDTCFQKIFRRTL
jgi:hypothetical protein